MKNRFEQRAFDVFNRKFEAQLPTFNNNHRKTFDAVSDEIEEVSEFRVFSSYESFKNARSRRNKNK